LTFETTEQQNILNNYITIGRGCRSMLFGEKHEMAEEKEGEM
jgi:hypothetical protein